MTLWAWTASIVVHLVVLAVFGVVRFSQFAAQANQRPSPTAKLSRVKKLTQAAPIIRKPRVKKASAERFAKNADRLLPTNGIFDTLEPDGQDLGNLAKPSVSQSALVHPRSTNLAKRIEFFGSFTDRRKVCYLVDCSGSMRGVFRRVRKELKDSIGPLQPDQYFYIIFFGGENLFELGNGRLLRATQKAKSAAYDFIDSVKPAGQTNTLTALERAVQIRDGQGAGPSVIYFLTDGFELTAGDERTFVQKIENLQKRFAPTTSINTIGFWPQRGDRKMLEAIARQSVGEFVLVADGDT